MVSRPGKDCQDLQSPSQPGNGLVPALDFAGSNPLNPTCPGCGARLPTVTRLLAIGPATAHTRIHLATFPGYPPRSTIPHFRAARLPSGPDQFPRGLDTAHQPDYNTLN